MKQNDFIIANCDTDSIMITKSNGSPFSDDEKKLLLDDLNSLYPDQINFTDDGYFDSVVILKAKNYILWNDKKQKKTTKGSALKGGNREKALAEFIGKFTDLLLKQDFNSLVPLYNNYVKEILNLKDITRWGSKKTISEKILTNTRTNEQRIRDALKGTEYSVGDRRYFFFDNKDRPSLIQNWNNNHSTDKLLEKLFKTVNIFKNVIELSEFPNYKLKRNKILLNNI